MFAKVNMRGVLETGTAPLLLLLLVVLVANVLQPLLVGVMRFAVSREEKDGGLFIPVVLLK